MSTKRAPRRWEGKVEICNGAPVQALRRVKTALALSVEYTSTPHSFVRGALFKAGRGDTRVQQDDYLEIAVHEGTRLLYRGTDLVVFDLLVWTKVVRELRRTAKMLPDGTMICRPVTFNIRRLCVLVGIDPTKESYIRIGQSLDALWSAEVVLEDYHSENEAKRGVRMFRLFSERAASESSDAVDPTGNKIWTARQVTLNVSEGVLALFEPAGYFQLDLAALKRLTKKPLAAWLYAYFASNRRFTFGMTYEKLRALSGLAHRPLNKFREDARSALELLLASGHVKDLVMEGSHIFHAIPTIPKPLSSATGPTKNGHSGATSTVSPPKPIKNSLPTATSSGSERSAATPHDAEFCTAEQTQVRGLKVARSSSAPATSEPEPRQALPEQRCAAHEKLPSWEELTAFESERFGLLLECYGNSELLSLLSLLPVVYARRLDLVEVVQQVREYCVGERAMSPQSFLAREQAIPR